MICTTCTNWNMTKWHGSYQNFNKNWPNKKLIVLTKTAWTKTLLSIFQTFWYLQAWEYTRFENTFVHVSHSIYILISVIYQIHCSKLTHDFSFKWGRKDICQQNASRNGQTAIRIFRICQTICFIFSTSTKQRTNFGSVIEKKCDPQEQFNLTSI